MRKSSRHSKIAGDFGETLVLYWLSKHGFEVAHIDHVGIDLLARNPHSDELMGISVKCRTRSPGTEKTSLNIPATDVDKVKSACLSFGAVPYFAIVIDAANQIKGYLLSLDRLLSLCPPGSAVIQWKMNELSAASYAADGQVKSFVLNTETLNWWKAAE